MMHSASCSTLQELRTCGSELRQFLPKQPLESGPCKALTALLMKLETIYFEEDTKGTFLFFVFFF